jgi:hypothetical protein
MSIKKYQNYIKENLSGELFFDDDEAIEIIADLTWGISNDPEVTELYDKLKEKIKEKLSQDEHIKLFAGTDHVDNYILREGEMWNDDPPGPTDIVPIHLLIDQILGEDFSS